MEWRCGRSNMFDMPRSPKTDERSSLHQTFRRCRQEQIVTNSSGTPPGPTKALQKARNRHRCVDLNDTVQIADVDAEFERTRGDDHTVLAGRECLLGAAALVEA